VKQLLKKFIALIITLFIVSLLAFLAFQIISGDPVTRMLGTEATPEAQAALRAELGLDRPVLVRYGSWLAGALRGDFGTSYSYSLPVSQMLADKLPITALLTLLSFAFTVVLSLPLGILAGSIQNKVLDRLFAALDQIVMSIPPFFIGIVVCSVCGLTLRLFTPGSFVSYQESWWGCAAYLVFPALSIAIPRIAMTVKLLRGSILNELGRDYVRTAQSRGASRRSILFRHVLKNALLPVITFLAVSMAEIITGSIIIEQVFTVPGIGRLLLTSINNRDYPVVQAIVVILAAWIVIVNFAADLLYQLVDPRLRPR
jgi:peptide/nickel transport system permease protein